MNSYTEGSMTLVKSRFYGRFHINVELLSLVVDTTPGVLMMTTLASEVVSSWVTAKSFPLSWVIKFSESTRFFEQPRVMTLTISFLSVFVFKLKS